MAACSGPGRAARFQRLALRARSLVARTNPTSSSPASSKMLICQRLRSRARGHRCSSWVVSWHDSSSRLMAAGLGTVVVSSLYPLGSLGTAGCWRKGSKVQPVLRMPAAIPFRVSRAPRSNSLRL